MATVLLTWEFGGALGHLLRLRPIGEALAARGHKVVFALRDLSRVAELFSPDRFTFVSVPPAELKSSTRPISGFVDILTGVGFSHEENLERLFIAWNRLFDEHQPDLVVADYSPFALLALRGRALPKVNMGLPFYYPPDAFPLPQWSVLGPLLPQGQLLREEQGAWEKVNRLLKKNSRPALERLSQLFYQLDDTILASYPELDPYGTRPHLRYWGHWQPGGGIDPVWPDVPGPKIYAYLRPFSGLPVLLEELRRLGAPTIVLASGIEPSLQARYSGPTMRFESHPLEVEKVAAQCDLAITNAGHGMICSMLLAGKPCLLIPLFGEQLFNAQVVAKVGAGRWVLPSSKAEIGPALRAMLTVDTHAKAAQAFAERYAGIKPGQQVPEIVDRLESLMTGR